MNIDQSQASYVITVKLSTNRRRVLTTVGTRRPIADGSSPGEVREDQRPLLGRHFVLLGAKLVEKLSAHCLEDGPEQRAAKDERGLVAG